MKYLLPLLLCLLACDDINSDAAKAAASASVAAVATPPPTPPAPQPAPPPPPAQAEGSGLSVISEVSGSGLTLKYVLDQSHNNCFAIFAGNGSLAITGGVVSVSNTYCRK